MLFLYLANHSNSWETQEVSPVTYVCVCGGGGGIKQIIKWDWLKLVTGGGGGRSPKMINICVTSFMHDPLFSQ